MYKVGSITVVFVIFFNGVFAQIGGSTSFGFVNFPSNARLAGVGGTNVSIYDQDPSMVFSNPALLNTTMHNHWSISHMRYYADITHSQSVFSFNHGKTGIWAIGAMFSNYGTINQTDITGREIGTASASDYLITFAKSHTINNITLGLNLKFAGTGISSYQANAVLADLGALFKHPKKQFTLGVLVKNLGFGFSNYATSTPIKVPLDVQLGTTYKLEHMPLRFSITYHHLHRWEISYNDPNRIASFDLNGNPQFTKVSFADNLFRHFVFGGEFIFKQGFHLRAGYNHFLRREMFLENSRGFGGFSVGAMFRIKAFELGYTVAGYHVVGPRHFFTLILNFDRFKKTQSEN